MDTMFFMLLRTRWLDVVIERLHSAPVVALLGARQVGKSTLARAVVARWDGETHLFDLEDPRHAARLADPLLALEPLRGLVVLDEVQHAPEIFRVLRDREQLASTGIGEQIGIPHGKLDSTGSLMLGLGRSKPGYSFSNSS